MLFLRLRGPNLGCLPILLDFLSGEYYAASYAFAVPRSVFLAENSFEMREAVE